VADLAWDDPHRTPSPSSSQLHDDASPEKRCSSSKSIIRPGPPSTRPGELSQLLQRCSTESESPRLAHVVPRICAALPAPHEPSISILTTLQVPHSSCDSDGSSREQGPRLSSSFRQWATHSLGDPSLPSPTSRMRRRLYDSPFFPTLW
jgi:hypothetical protein